MPASDQQQVLDHDTFEVCLDDPLYIKLQSHLVLAVMRFAEETQHRARTPAEENMVKVACAVCDRMVQLQRRS